jgi:uncharacterized DUF497 family protein
VIFEWNERKRRVNLRKHGIDFSDAERVLAGPTLTWEDDRLAYSERRFVSLGLLEDGVVQIVYTAEPECIRVISMRGATRRETESFFTQIAD